MAKWQINLENLAHGGLAPLWFRETYPSYGNKNMAGTMQNMDLTNPGFITQGPGLSNLTNGTQAGAVTTLIKSIKRENEADVAYAVGGNMVYKLTPTTVVDDVTWPITIDKAAVTGESGEDVAYFEGQVLYSYNHSGSAGDVGSVDLSDPDFMSTVPGGGAALSSGVSPHQMVVGDDAVLYIADGRYVATYQTRSGNDYIPQALDFPVFTRISSIQWMQDRLWIAANSNYAGTANFPIGKIYLWDGRADTWDRSIVVNGTLGGMYQKKGVMFFFYQDASSTTEYKLAYVNGNSYEDVATFQGSLPNYAQISEYNDFLIWNSSGALYAYGSGHPDLPPRFFQLADGGYSTVGGVGNPFGTVFVSSNDGGSNYRLAKFSGYDTASNWKSLLFDVTGGERQSKIDSVRLSFLALSTGARVDWSLKDDKGTTIYSDTISYAKHGGAVTTVFCPLNGKVAENLRVELDYTNGSATNPVKMRSIKIHGTTN
jgi:hypothetical protein